MGARERRTDDKELERSSALGVGACAFIRIAGTASGGVGEADREGDRNRAGEDRFHHPILVENTAGAGKTSGKDCRGGRRNLSHVPKSLRARPDTDSIHATYCVRLRHHEIEAGAHGGAGRIRERGRRSAVIFHLNDSEGELGRTGIATLIGEGRIGKEPFEWLMHDTRSKGIPLILENPQQNYESPMPTTRRTLRRQNDEASPIEISVSMGNFRVPYCVRPTGYTLPC